MFSIKDANGELALKIEGPVCTFSICGDVEFKVLSPGDTFIPLDAPQGYLITLKSLS